MPYAAAPIHRTVRVPVDRARDLGLIGGVAASFQLVVLGQPIPEFGQVVGGALLVLVGLALFVEGLTLGHFPIRETLACAFARRGRVSWLLTVFGLGPGTMVGGARLLAIADEASKIAADVALIDDDPAKSPTYADGLRHAVALAAGFAIIRVIEAWAAHRRPYQPPPARFRVTSPEPCQIF